MKIYSAAEPSRYQDLDDIKEIMRSVKVDTIYVKGRLEAYGSAVSSELLALLNYP